MLDHLPLPAIFSWLNSAVACIARGGELYFESWADRLF
jgi:hypothetical protein